VLKTRLLLLALLLSFAFLLTACGGGSESEKAASQDPQISGQIADGLRVLTIHPTTQDQHFTIYRGDYVRAQLTTGESFTIKIAALDVDKQFPAPEGEKPYFKVPDAGSFRFSVGGGNGVIEAIEYVAQAYREVGAAEGAKFIDSVQPVIVDVRTPGEFDGGHLKDARLIPVQEFQKRVGELGNHKNDPVFVYCRTGNRSTVAAKILIDNGFTNVVNLRNGIVEWRRLGLPVTR
jgi:rhodanese-related sulfurtransferase